MNEPRAEAAATRKMESQSAVAVAEPESAEQDAAVETEEPLAIWPDEAAKAVPSASQVPAVLPVQVPAALPVQVPGALPVQEAAVLPLRAAAEGTPERAVDTEAEALPPSAETGGDPGLDKLRDAIVQALDDKGHQTAAALLGAGNWRESGETVEVAVAVKKLMLGLVMNPEADKIAKAVMREMGRPPRLSVVPGEGGSSRGTARPSSQGSVQTQALDNPLVKQAQELFRAEVRSILDLRDKPGR